MNDFVKLGLAGLLALFVLTLPVSCGMYEESKYPSHEAYVNAKAAEYVDFCEKNPEVFCD